MKRLDGAVALVTGGNTGIGRAVCQAFAREGARLVVGWISQENAARELVDGLRAAGGEAEAVRVDVTCEDSVKALGVGLELTGQ